MAYSITDLLTETGDYIDTEGSDRILARYTNDAFTASLSFVGSFTPLRTKLLTATLSFAGSFTKQCRRQLSGLSSFVGHMRSIASYIPRAYSITDLLTETGDYINTEDDQRLFVRYTSDSFTALLNFVGSLATQAGTIYIQALAGTLDFVGSCVKSCGKAISGSLSFSGSNTKRTNRTFPNTGTGPRLLSSGTVHKFTSTTRTGTLHLHGRLHKLWMHLLIATLNFSTSFANLHQLLFQSLSASLSFSGSLSRRFAKTLRAALRFRGIRELTRRGVARIFASIVGKVSIDRIRSGVGISEEFYNYCDTSQTVTTAPALLDVGDLNSVYTLLIINPTLSQVLVDSSSAFDAFPQAVPPYSISTVATERRGLLLTPTNQSDAIYVKTVSGSGSIRVIGVGK